MLYLQSKVCASDWMYLFLVQLLRESHLKGEKMLETVLVTRSESIFFPHLSVLFTDNIKSNIEGFPTLMDYIKWA